MINLTIAVDEEILRRAEQRASSEGSSVDQVLRNLLESYAGASSEQRAALEDLIELWKTTKAGHVGKRWTREDLYDRPGLRRR